MVFVPMTAYLLRLCDKIQNKTNFKVVWIIENGKGEKVANRHASNNLKRERERDHITSIKLLIS